MDGSYNRLFAVTQLAVLYHSSYKYNYTTTLARGKSCVANSEKNDLRGQSLKFAHSYNFSKNIVLESLLGKQIDYLNLLPSQVIQVYSIEHMLCELRSIRQLRSYTVYSYH